MKKRIIFSTLLMISAALVLSACTVGNKKTDEVNDQTKEMGIQEDGSFIGNLKDLVGFGKSQKCTWEDEIEEISGVTYTDGKRSYSEINNVVVANYDQIGQPQANGEQKKGSMYTFYDGEYIYSWSSASKQGMKMKDMPEDQFMDEDEYYEEDEMYNEDNSDYMESMETETSYNCSPWNVDKSKFDLPKGIEFQDLSVMMEETKNNFGNMNNVCAMLEGEEKDSCIADWAEAQEQINQMTQ